MAVTTELRYEMKLVCEPYSVPQARSWIRLHPAAFVDSYQARRVNTVYFDTPHLACFNDNLAGVSDREKLRLRWYGDKVHGVQPCLELKQKRNLLGRKVRWPLPCLIDLRLPWRDVLEVVRGSAGLTFGLAMQTRTQPTLITRYWREYFVTPDGEVRCTLDYDQQSYDQRLGMSPNLTARLLIREVVVIEVKAPRDQAERLWEIVAGFPVRRSRNSKYALGLVSAVGSE